MRTESQLFAAVFLLCLGVAAGAMSKPAPRPEGRKQAEGGSCALSKPIAADVRLSFDGMTLQVATSPVNAAAAELDVSTEVRVFGADGTAPLAARRSAERGIAPGYADTFEQEFSFIGLADGHYVIQVTVFARGRDGGRIECRRYVEVRGNEVREAGVDEFYETSGISAGKRS